MPTREEEQEKRQDRADCKEDHLEENQGGDRVREGREAAKDERQRADPEDGRKAKDGNVRGHRHHLLLKGLLVHLEVRLGVEVPLRPGLSDDEE